MTGDDRQGLAPQVARVHYCGRKYLGPARMASYGYQLQELLAVSPDSVLELGIGSGLVAYCLRRGGLAITTLDLDPELEPNVVGSVTDLPFPDGSYDVIGCFEVLEHIPWSLVPIALREIYRVCGRYAVISLPDARTVIRVHIPLVLRQQLFNRPFWRPKEHTFDGEHYWEINKSGYPLKEVMACLAKPGFRVGRTFRPWEMSRHRFFRLEKADE